MKGRMQAWATILMAGGAAGAIDFIFASVMTISSGNPLWRTWGGVAAALFGKETTLQIGTPMAFVGAALHFLITIVAAAIYYLVATRQPFLTRHRVVSAIVFGFLFFLAMNYVITPLSAMHHPIYRGTKAIVFAIITHVIIIGFPTSLITAWRLDGTRRTVPAIALPPIRTATK
jgi:uncharacterized membrane protein